MQKICLFLLYVYLLGVHLILEMICCVCILQVTRYVILICCMCSWPVTWYVVCAFDQWGDMLCVCLTGDMMLVLWRALVLQVSKLLDVADTTCAKSDRVDAFTATMSALRLVVAGQLLQPPQMLVSLACCVALIFRLHCGFNSWP